MKFKFNNKFYIFEFKPFPTICFLLVLIILISLSAWQFKRLSWKNALIDYRISQFEAQPVELKEIPEPSNNQFKKILVNGVILDDYEFFMPALSKNGNNGYHILVPLMISDQKYIIYDRGWIPLEKKEKNKRTNELLNLKKKYTAVIRIPGRKGYFQPENDPEKNFWFFVEPSLMEKKVNLPLEKSFYLEAVESGSDGLPIGGQTRIYLRNNHLQYALTWLMLAVSLVGVFFFRNLKKK